MNTTQIKAARKAQTERKVPQVEVRIRKALAHRNPRTLNNILKHPQLKEFPPTTVKSALNRMSDIHKKHTKPGRGRPQEYFMSTIRKPNKKVSKQVQQDPVQSYIKDIDTAVKLLRSAGFTVTIDR